MTARPKATRPHDPLLTVEGLSPYLGQKPRTLYKWAAQGKIPSLKFGRKSLRFRLEDVMAALEAYHRKASK